MSEEKKIEQLKGLTKDLNTQMTGFQKMPYATKICFSPLVEKLKRNIAMREVGLQEDIQHILNVIEATPELCGPIDDPEVLKKYKHIVEFLMNNIFPLGKIDTILGRAMAPFSLEQIYITPALEALITEQGMKLTLERSLHFDPNMTIIHAGIRILDLHYGFKVNFEMPYAFSAELGDKIKYYKTEANLENVILKVNGTPPEITRETFNMLIKNLYNPKLWLETLPPEHFEFHGFIAARLFEVTQEESLSRLKQKLLEKEGVLNKENIIEMESLLQSYFNIPKLKLGLTAIDYPIEQSVLHKYKIRYDFLSDRVDQLLDHNYDNSIYYRACKYKTEVIYEDLETASPKTALENLLIHNGIRAIMIVPLMDKQDKIIGLLEIGHPEPYGFTFFDRLYMEEITDLFRIAVERSRNEVDNQIDSIIREKYTALHPSVEWKFIEAANKYLTISEEYSNEIDAEEIVFSDVYPLYGQIDIVSSSAIRNSAIRHDMLLNLKLIRRLLDRSKKMVTFPLVNKYSIKLDEEIQELKDTMTSANENRLATYITEELHPLLLQLQELSEPLKDIIDEYFLKLNSRMGIIYQKRKDYENSVALLNNALSQKLEKTQVEAQKMIPHYFEKYKTDGIEYDMYVGQSILSHGTFGQVHLFNIRLWQLINMCDLTKLSKKKGKKLPIALETAQLIFVHDQPISIRFRTDEKQFDIDGAYNVSYEIIKKRIDKSTIVGTDERLTVVGKIAIVYTSPATREEYLDYFEYLKSENYILDEIEEIELNQLQGVTGLKALRVSVNLASGKEKEKGLKIA